MKSTSISTELGLAPTNCSLYALQPLQIENKMCISPSFTWRSFPLNLSRLPLDVKFRLVDNNGNIRDFSAHKALLACISEVFAQQFYGPTTKVKNGIKVCHKNNPTIFLDH